MPELSSWLAANGFESFEGRIRDELGVTDFGDLEFCVPEDLSSIGMSETVMKQFLAALANPGVDELSQDLERCRAQYGARFEHIGQLFSNDEFMADEGNHTLESCKQLCLDLGGGSFTFSWGKQATIFAGKANWESAGGDYQAYELTTGSEPTGNTMAFEELFGKTILTKDGEKPTCEALANKTHVMVYFSAHWCPPCRGYTPELSAAYTGSAKAGKETAIVFASSDQDQAGFDEYYGEMSFYALPFQERRLKDTISEKYGVSGIPTLVLLDGGGNLVEDNIRGRHSDYL